MAVFPTFLFQAIQATRVCFTIFYNKKMNFQAIKKRSSKGRKIEITPKGLTDGFGPKMAIFSPFFLGNIGQEIVFYNIQEQKNNFLGCKNKKFKKWKTKLYNDHFSSFCLGNIGQGNVFYDIQAHGFGPKMAIFQSLFFLSNIGQQSVFYNILRQKKKQISRQLKKQVKKLQKLRFFQRGSQMVLVQKWPFFELSFQAIWATKMCFAIFQNEKTPFQAIKTRSSKSRKIDIFPKWLTHGFAPKMAIFPTFFARQYRSGKCLL